MARFETVRVYLDIERFEQPAPMGVLHCQGSGAGEVLSFEYDRGWLEQPEAFAFDPDLVLVTGHQYPAPNRTNFGVFMDSSPDRWGRVLMQRRENTRARQEKRKPRALTQWDFLLGVHDQTRLGALRFRPSIGGDFIDSDTRLAAPPITSLRELQGASLKFEQHINEEEHPDYGRWLYNHDDALMYEERLHEYAEEDEEGNRGQYEFPEVEKALPECIRKTLKRECSDWRTHDRELLRKARSCRYGSQYMSWFERLRSIQRLSRLPLKHSRDCLESGYYDAPPLPSLLVSFKEHDAIIACFDEEGQSMMECTAEPTVCVVFSPRKADEVRHARRIVERFVAFNCAVFQLVEEIQAWEKCDAGTCIDRGEPSLRAA